MQVTDAHGEMAMGCRREAISRRATYCYRQHGGIVTGSEINKNKIDIYLVYIFVCAVLTWYMLVLVSPKNERLHVRTRT